jgi:hypothetical protein
MGCSMASVAQPLMCGAEMVGTVLRMWVAIAACVFTGVVQKSPAAEA